MEKITKRVVGVLVALLVFSALLVGAVSAALEVEISIYDSDPVYNWTYKQGSATPSELSKSGNIYGSETFYFDVAEGDTLRISFDAIDICVGRFDSEETEAEDERCTFIRQFPGEVNSLRYLGVGINGEPVSDPSGWIDLSKTYTYSLDPSETSLSLVLFTSSSLAESFPPVPNVDVNEPPTFLVGATDSFTYTVTSGDYALDQFVVKSNDETIATADINTGEKTISVTGQGVGETSVDLIWLPSSSFGLHIDPITVNAAPKVTFNPNGGGGDLMPDQTILPGKTVPLNANTYTAPDPDTQRFLEWNTDWEGKGTTYYDKQPIADLEEDLGLFAQWTDKSNILVKFNANGGTGSMHVQPVTSGVASNLNKNTFIYPAKKFTKWSTQPDGSGIPYDDEGGVTIYSDMTLYAIWEDATDEYTVTFDANGGKGSMDNQIFTAGTAQALSKNTINPVDDTERFIQWNTAADGSGTPYNDQQEITLTGNLKLYAQWGDATKCVVTFDPNGGTGSMEAQLFTPKEAQKLIPNEFNPPTDKKFAHWNTLATGAGGWEYEDEEEITIESDMLLYARWIDAAEEEYTVTFHANGGSGTMTPQTFEAGVRSDLWLNGFEDPTGEKFVQWNTAADGKGTPYTAGQGLILTADLDLYAQWTDENDIVVTFNPTDGDGNMFAQIFASSEDVQSLNKNAYTRKGMVFSGWTDDYKSMEVVYEDMEECSFEVDTELLAVWEKGTGPVITFHANDGTEDTTEQYVESGVETALDPNKFTYEGFQFLTWNTEEKGAGVTYVDEQVVNLTDDLDLYAQWISEEEGGTVVSLTKEDGADYEFSVPPTVELNKKLDGMVAGEVEIIVYKSLGEEGTYVNLLLTSDADEVPKDFSTFHVGNPKVEGGFATYTMATYSDAKMTSYEHDIYGAQTSGGETYNNIVMDMSGVTPGTSTKYIGFTTASLPSITGTYYGSLTFDAELVSPK